ncbi:MAG TPA: ATP-binding protein [Thermoanaerobaculia bacterium]|jgi:signal transduction histidine kinase/CheY-like chemotaxis protein
MTPLLHIGNDDGALVEQFRERGIEVVSSAATPQPDRAYDVVIIAPEVESPLQLARRIRSAAPDAHIVFLTTFAAEGALRRELMIGRIGTLWSIAPADDLELAADIVRAAIAGTERRKKLRTTLGRVNLQLAQPAAAARRTVISDHFLALVLEQLSDAVVVLDPDGIVLAWNGAAARAFGEIHRGVPFRETLPPAARDAIVAACRAPEGRAESVLVASESGIEYGLRATAFRRDGVVGIAVVARDVTAARREERQRQLVADAVRVLASTLDIGEALQGMAELLVRELADVAAVDIVEGESVNRYAVAARTERERACLEPTRGNNLAANRHHPSPEAISRCETVMSNHLDDAMLAAMASNEQHLAILRELRPHAFMAVPLRGGDTTLGAIAVARTSGGDFSEADVATVQELARQAAAALHNIWSYRSAAEANRLKDEFLATLSHELRTPMTSILGWAQILRLEDTPPELVRDGLESIERSARAQAQLIDDLLDLSRMQMGKVQFQARPFSLSAVVRAAVETVRPAAQARDVTLRIAAEGDIVINGDPDRMQQVIWNLLSNAVKFSEPASEVRVSVTARGTSAQVAVTDHGRGISADFLPHVFDRFRQADAATTRRYGGLGLGLAIVKQLVEMHGGTVRASSAGIGRGATFTVTVPVPTQSRQEAAPAPAPVEVQSPTPQLADLAGVCLLVVEDDAASAHTLCTLLERAGAEVRSAATVAAALESLRGRIPDVLISDVAMPDEDGLALIRAIRGRLRIAADRLPAIALTAFHDVDLRVALLGAGFQRFMTKPVDAQALSAVVATLARKGR